MHDNQLVFCSYSHDDISFVRRLAADLKHAGVNVWLDHFNIDPGREWDRSVQSAIGESCHVLVILSPSAVASAIVMDEISLALDRQKHIIPIIYKSCEIPLRLRRLQYIDFGTDFASSFDQLLMALSQRPENIRDSTERVGNIKLHIVVPANPEFSAWDAIEVRVILDGVTIGISSLMKGCDFWADVFPGAHELELKRRGKTFIYKFYDMIDPVKYKREATTFQLGYIGQYEIRVSRNELTGAFIFGPAVRIA